MAQTNTQPDTAVIDAQEVQSTEKQNTKQAETQIRKNNAGVDAALMPSGEKFLAALAYVQFFCVLPLVLKPKSKLCQLHGKQGLILTVAFLIAGVLGWFSAGMGNFVSFAHVVIAIFGITKAVAGKMYTFPGFGDLIAKLDWDQDPKEK